MMVIAKIKKMPLWIKGKILKCLKVVQLKRRQAYLKKERLRLNNKEVTLLSNNCNGGVLLHELGLRFNSPFVNINIVAKDYLKYLSHFEYYNALTPTFDKTSDKAYPVGKLDDVTIEFVHYNSNEEALSKWEERKKRIDNEKIFVIFTEQADCRVMSRILCKHLVNFFAN